MIISGGSDSSHVIVGLDESVAVCQKDPGQKSVDDEVLMLAYDEFKT